MCQLATPKCEDGHAQVHVYWGYRTIVAFLRISVTSMMDTLYPISNWRLASRSFEVWIAHRSCAVAVAAAVAATVRYASAKLLTRATQCSLDEQIHQELGQ